MKPSKGLDFSQFKKVHEDAKVATLMHPGGHKITIAKNALSKPMRSTLSKLPLYQDEGGQVPDPNADQSQQSSQAPSQAPVVVNVNNGPQPFVPGQNYQNAPLPGQANAEYAPKAQSGSMISPEAQRNMDLYGQPGAPKETLNQAPSEPVPSSPQANPGLASVGETAPNGPAQSAQAPQSGLLPQYGNAMMGGIQQQIQGEKALAGAQSSGLSQEAGVFKKQAEANDKLVQDFQGSQQKLADEYQNMVHDIQQNHINPNHYLENRTVPQRIATAIGLILGGAGSGLAGGSNPALDFLNKQIERDVSAQEKEQSKRFGVVEANQNLMRSQRDSADMLRLMKTAGYEAQIKQAAAQSGSAQANANADIAIGKLRQQMIPTVLGMSLRNSLENNPNSDHSQMLNLYRQLNPEAAKEFEGRLVPFIGAGQIPVDAKTRGEIVSRQDLQSKIEDLSNFAKTHSGDLRPEEITAGRTKAALVQDAYRRANGQGVFREAEKNFVEGIVDQDPTKFLASFRTLPKYQELSRDNSASLEALLNSIGIRRGTNSRGSQGFVPKTFRPSK